MKQVPPLSQGGGDCLMEADLPFPLLTQEGIKRWQFSSPSLPV